MRGVGVGETCSQAGCLRRGLQGAAEAPEQTDRFGPDAAGHGPLGALMQQRQRGHGVPLSRHRVSKGLGAHSGCCRNSVLS